MPFRSCREKARRRDPRRYNYAAITCPSYKTGECERALASSGEVHNSEVQCWPFLSPKEQELRREQPSGGDLTRYHDWSFGEIRVLAYALAQGPATHQEAIVESSGVLHSLEMLNIRDGEYEIPRTLQGGRKFG
ncbi:unnamed protein product [Ilex paraguariensis]|uniref:Uncharacterized protein n=1 Tax=Ilex paraguariensis TaxID=185542 RepID=A0ABC8QUR0_9AQUA